MNIVDRILHAVLGVNPPSKRISQRCSLWCTIQWAASEEEMREEMKEHYLICQEPITVGTCEDRSWDPEKDTRRSRALARGR